MAFGSKAIGFTSCHTVVYTCTSLKFKTLYMTTAADVKVRGGVLSAKIIRTELHAGSVK